MKKIIDISTFDRSVNFEKMKAAGIAGVIIRAGYATEVDAYWMEHIKGANASGMPAGVYWFSYAYTRDMARAEAQACLRAIKPYRITLPVYFDFEGDSMAYAKKQGVTVSRSLLNSMAETFCDAIETAGYKAGIYFNKDYRLSKYYESTLKKYSKWYAYYNSTLDYTEGVDLWQYTSTAEVPGVPAPQEDMNYLLNEELLRSEKPGEPVRSVEYTKALQRALNSSYGTSLVIDGSCGPKTLAVIREHYLSYRSPTIKNEHVEWLQAALVLLGYILDVDGSFGPETYRIVTKFQGDKKLTVDGLAGPATHQMILANLE